MARRAGAVPSKVPCAHCGAEDAVPFDEIDFDAEPAVIEIDVDVASDPTKPLVNIVQAKRAAENPLYGATQSEYPKGVRYGHAAACTKCKHVQMPRVKDEDAPGAPNRPPRQSAGIGIVAGPPPVVPPLPLGRDGKKE